MSDWLHDRSTAMEAHRERESKVLARHASDCFGAMKCISCGCDRRGAWSADGEPRACVSHAGTPAHMASIAEQALRVQERIAKALENRP